MVLGLVEKCQLRQGHHVTFDNLFTSLPLLDQLSAAGIGGTGTARENRIQKDCILTKCQDEQTEERICLISVH